MLGNIVYYCGPAITGISQGAPLIVLGKSDHRHIDVLSDNRAVRSMPLFWTTKCPGNLHEQVSYDALKEK
jgi:hypothetical protein